jgi:DNA mismatch endonuclease, patch repair protein
MPDIVDAKTRSRMMSGIGAKDTAPEMIVRRYLHATGLRFRLHDKRLPGRPDLSLPQYGAVIFVHGCFWHRHFGCRFATTPSTRADFWNSKFATNVERDLANVQALQGAGWTVFTIWECEIKNPQSLDSLFWKIVSLPRRDATSTSRRRSAGEETRVGAIQGPD